MVNPALVWQNPKIPVCWDAATYRVEDEWQRAAVRDAIRNTWERAFDRPYIPREKRVEFLGWGICQPNEKGIRIAVRDERPHSSLGSAHQYFSDAEMVLNFTYKNFSKDCGDSREDKERCTRAIAVHEFAHALGVHHEQDRQDTPQACLDELEEDDRRRSEGLINVDYYGEWDECSISNYCNPIWNNGGRLSLQDIMFIQLAYYPEVANRQEWCRQLMFADTYGIDPNASSTSPQANTDASSVERPPATGSSGPSSVQAPAAK